MWTAGASQKSSVVLDFSEASARPSAYTLPARVRELIARSVPLGRQDRPRLSLSTDYRRPKDVPLLKLVLGCVQQGGQYWYGLLLRILNHTQPLPWQNTPVRSLPPAGRMCFKQFGLALTPRRT